MAKKKKSKRKPSTIIGAKVYIGQKEFKVIDVYNNRVTLASSDGAQVSLSKGHSAVIGLVTQ